MTTYITDPKEVMKAYIKKILSEKKEIFIKYHNYDDIAVLINTGDETDSFFVWKKMNEYQVGFCSSGNLESDFESKEDALAWAVSKKYPIYTVDIDMEGFMLKSLNIERKKDELQS